MSLASVITAAVTPSKEKSPARKTRAQYRSERELEFQRDLADARAHVVDLTEAANAVGSLSAIPGELAAKLDVLAETYIGLEAVRLLEVGGERRGKFTDTWISIHDKKQRWLRDLRATRTEMVGSVSVQIPKIESAGYREAARTAGHMIASEIANTLDLVEAHQTKQSATLATYLADADEVAGWSEHLDALLRVNAFLELKWRESNGQVGGLTAPIGGLALTVAAAEGHPKSEDAQKVMRALLVSRQWVESRGKN
jgi:hypothetical protein